MSGPTRDLLVPEPQAKAVRLKRGGRFGVRLAVVEVTEGLWMHAQWTLLGLLVAAIGFWDALGGVGLYLAAVGGFFAGFALCNGLWVWQGEPVEGEGSG